MALVTAGCDGDDDDGMVTPPTTDPASIAELAADQDNLTTLVAALEAAGLDATLADENATFTVFAPADAAFDAYDVDFLVGNTDLLSEVLQFHVVQGAAALAGDLSDGDTFTTVQGDDITVSIRDGSVFVNGAQVTTADVEASNGVVHIIDDVLLTNRTAGERLLVTNATESLYNAIDQAGLADAFNDPNNEWTTFAPNNAAFGAADLSGFSDTEVQAILQYHTLDGITDSAALLQLLADNGGEVSVATNQGEEITFREEADGSISLNGGQATLDLENLDQRASNGIIHQIDGVLVPPTLQPPSLAGLVSETSSLSTLNAALGAVGLDATLADEAATFTVFAPEDASFAPYDVEYLLDNPTLLEEVLGFHVVQGAAVFSGDLSDGDTFTTVQGDDITISISDGNVFVDGAQVTTPDVAASNGVAHLIDDVLLTNRTVVERATVTSDFSILADLVGEAGLADALSGPGPDGEDGITVFAPTNAAFLAALDANDNGTIDSSEIPSNAADILQYHVLDDVFFAADVPTSETALPTLEGADVTVVRSGSEVTINPNADDASVVAPDVEASNGVIHGIDTVLIPPSN
jgi:transforming growth factor-beta-induced protein